MCRSATKNNVYCKLGKMWFHKSDMKNWDSRFLLPKADRYLFSVQVEVFHLDKPLMLWMFLVNVFLLAIYQWLVPRYLSQQAILQSVLAGNLAFLCPYLMLKSSLPPRLTGDSPGVGARCICPPPSSDSIVMHKVTGFHRQRLSPSSSCSRARNTLLGLFSVCFCFH